MLTDEGLGSLCEGFRRQTSLKEISLKFSECERLTDVGLKSIAHSLKDLASLQRLTLEFGPTGYYELSCFSEKGRRNLSQTLKKMVSLKSVQIQVPDIKTTDIGMQDLSQDLKHLTSLRKIHLNFNWYSPFTDEGIKVFTQNLEALCDLESIELRFQE